MKLFNDTGNVTKKKLQQIQFAKKGNKGGPVCILQLVVQYPGMKLRGIKSEVSYLLQVELDESTICRFLQSQGLTRQTMQIVARGTNMSRQYLLLKCQHMWPDLGKPSVRDLRTICAKHVFSSSGQNLSKSRFVISMSNQPSNCSRRLWRLAVIYKGEISFPLDSPSLYSCRVRSPLLRDNYNSHARAI